MALRLIRGFRAISEDAALALAGLPPIDLVSGRTDGKRRGGEGGHTSSSLS